MSVLREHHHQMDLMQYERSSYGTHDYNGGMFPYVNPQHGSPQITVPQQRNPFIGRSLCVVCGDRARGCNFGAITCASCKEFFRRNAFKVKKLKCYFHCKCEINVYSRRFCAACRLSKCYAVGMKNEYIMSEEEKCQRQNKISERKLNAKNRMKTPQMPNDIQYPSDSNQTEQKFNDVEHFSVKQEFDQFSDEFILSFNESSMESSKPDSLYSPVSIMPENESFFNTDSFEVTPTINQYSTFQMYTDVTNREGEQVTLEESVKKLLKTVKIIRESNYYPTKFHLLVRAKENYRRLTSHISCKLKYLTSIVQIMQAETIYGLPTDQKFIDLIQIAQIVTFNFIKMCKRLYAFQELSPEDQVALVKGGVMETLMIWSMMTINLEKECWEALDLERNIKFSLQMEQMKDANPNLYEKHRSYALSFEPEWRYNDNLMSLLIAIALFNPDRNGICDIHKIRKERNAYCNLLKQYLLTMYEENIVNDMFLRLMNQLKLTETISEYHVKAYFDVNTNEVSKNGLGGIIMEIFDLNN